jgi:hypothetical protein
MLFLSFNVSSQELFASIGKNFTKYKYTNSLDETVIGLQRSSGSFYEAGVAYELDYDKYFFFASSITYNQFNTNAKINASEYSWNTNYLGLQNVIAYNFFSTHTTFAIQAKLGLNLSHIISGEQDNNGVFFDLTNEPALKGVFIQPLVGLDLSYDINDRIYISCGYNFSKAFSTNSSSEKISFSNHQIQIGLHFRPSYN